MWTHMGLTGQTLAEQAEIEARAHAIQEARLARNRDLTLAELDQVLEPVECHRTRQRRQGLKWS